MSRNTRKFLKRYDTELCTLLVVVFAAMYLVPMFYLIAAR